MAKLRRPSPALSLVGLLACAPALREPTPSEPARAALAPAPAVSPQPLAKADSARGGRYFDRWWRYDPSFKPDRPDTPALDGEGGPHQNGTLTRGGLALANTGHDYRLKNFFGWDLRGHDGISGPEFQASQTVVDHNLLEDPRDAEALAAWLADGDASIPAFGDVLSPLALADLARFIVDTREGRLPRPEQLFSLSKTAPRHYTLNTGADLEAGHAAIAGKCSGGFCHGVGGNAIVLDDVHSLGSYSRSNAHEAWFKIINGQPGTGMGRQTENAQEVLDILAALCDRTVYPPETEGSDVPDGDPRCGAYLR